MIEQFEQQMKEYDYLLEQMMKLDTTRFMGIILELIKRKKLDFVELSNMYVKYLEEQYKSKTHSISSLGLMLGMYCMTDTSSTGKAARKHLYESGMYGHNDGCKFGQMLDEEFGGTKEDINLLK